MKKVTRIFSILLALTWFAASSPAVSAQDYDDDLYYSPSKAKKEEAKRQKEAAERQKQLNSQYSRQADFAGSDAYDVSSTRPLTVDVDTYNRRGSYTPDNSTAQGGELGGTDFENTRRIERFHNSDIITETGDTALMQYYYSQPEAQPVNIYVVNSIDPWSNWAYRPSWRWRFGSPYWSFGWGYDPWYDWAWGYDPFWGPSWGWNWGWSWGYPSWGWGPGYWGPAWGPGYWGPSYSGNWGYNRPGANRPHAPSYGNGMAGNRPHSPAYGNARPGSSNRPGNMGRPSYGNNQNYPSQGVRPSQGNDNSNYAPSNNSRRGRNNNNSGTNRQNSNSYNNNNYNSNRNSHNSGSSFSRPGNSGFGGGGFGGGSRGGGGGGSRGRGR